MEFRILGPLEVVSETGLVKVPGAKCRALLAMLLVRANTVVTSDRLVEDLWEASPPESATATLQSYVYQLRKCLPPDSLRTRAGGYLLEVEPRAIDAVCFERMLGEASRPEGAAPEWVVARLTEALSWWRGPALADFQSAVWAQVEAARLNGLRLDTIERLGETRLTLGEHQQLVVPLESLVAQHPLRERLWAQLMMALYRSDRQADALRAYSRLRRHLGEELGIEPSRELVRLEEAILLQKPELDWQPPPTAPRVEPPAGASFSVPDVLQHAAGQLFVGRTAEVDLLIRAWKETRVGERRAVLIGGEPGVGKTRLAAELSRFVAADGAGVLYGRCEEDIGIPYQPWVETLRYLIVHEPRDLFTELGPEQGGALARLMPELAHRFRVPPNRPPSYPDVDRHLLFGAVIGLIARACSKCPFLLVLEDLHWADKQSLQLLRHLIGSSEPRRLLLIGTYRPTDLAAEHPLTDVLAALHREPHVQRVYVQGLSDDDVVGLLEAMAGHALDDAGIALAHAVHRETDGNPFFTNEILRHLTETGANSQRDDGRWIAELDFLTHGGLPTSIREVIGRRVARLGAETEQTLRAAAVIGRDFELDVLVRVTDQSEDRVLDLLDPAIRAVLIQDLPQRPNGFTFSHALVERTLYDDLGPTRQRRLHLRVATALEALCGDDPADRVSSLAYHWARASPPADAAKAIGYARRAGDRAIAQWAPDDAVGWYGQVLELLDRQPVDDEEARCEALVRLGNAQRMAGHPRTRDTLVSAGDLARRLGSRALLVRAALATNRGVFSVAGAVDEQQVVTLEAALTATADADAPERAMLLAILATELTWVDPNRAKALSDAALAMARRIDDDATLEGVLWTRPFPIWSPATLDERTADAYELREVAGRLGSRHYRSAQSAENIVLAAMCRGDLEEVDDSLDVLIRFAAESGLGGWRRLVAHHLAWRRLLAGDIDEAERAAGEALQMHESGPGGLTDALTMYALQIYPIRLAQGRLAEIIEPLKGAYAANPGVLTRAAFALALCELDRLDEARHVYEPLVANRFTDFFFNTTWLVGMTACAEVAGCLEHRAAAAVLAELLAPWRDQLACAGIICAGSVARPLGLALATAGRFDEADEAFAQAAAVHERIDAPIDLARTRLNWSRMLMRRGGPGDHEKARALLDAALITAIELGLVTIQRQTQALWEALAANR